MLLFEYPKCSTCQKAKKYLESKNFNYKSRNIVIDKLNVYELDRLIQKSGKDINKFFNTSGLKYKELKLKDKIQTMSYEEKLQVLSSDGMLVKRPLLELDDSVLIGFKELIDAFESLSENGYFIFAYVLQDGFYHFFMEFSVMVVGFFAFWG